LNTLILSANSFAQGAAQGTAIGTVQGTPAGSTLSLSNSDSGAVQLVSGVIQVGATPTSPSAFNIQITEALSGATNSPNATTLFSYRECNRLCPDANRNPQYATGHAAPC